VSAKTDEDEKKVGEAKESKPLQQASDALLALAVPPKDMPQDIALFGAASYRNAAKQWHAARKVAGQYQDALKDELGEHLAQQGADQDDTHCCGPMLRGRRGRADGRGQRSSGKTSTSKREILKLKNLELSIAAGEGSGSGMVRLAFAVEECARFEGRNVSVRFPATIEARGDRVQFAAAKKMKLLTNISQKADWRTSRGRVVPVDTSLTPSGGGPGVEKLVKILKTTGKNVEKYSHGEAEEAIGEGGETSFGLVLASRANNVLLDLRRAAVLQKTLFGMKAVLAQRRQFASDGGAPLTLIEIELVAQMSDPNDPKAFSLSAQASNMRMILSSTTRSLAEEISGRVEKLVGEWDTKNDDEGFDLGDEWDQVDAWLEVADQLAEVGQMGAGFLTRSCPAFNDLVKKMADGGALEQMRAKHAVLGHVLEDQRDSGKERPESGPDTTPPPTMGATLAGLSSLLPPALYSAVQDYLLSGSSCQTALARRRLLRKLHPDKGGSKTGFQLFMNICDGQK
jgi:hypothetical protein